VGSLAFLLVAGLLILVGSMVLWLRERKPSSMESGIEEFSREMKALAPERRAASGGPRRRRSARPGGRAIAED
jgi:hypothetical protein